MRPLSDATLYVAVNQGWAINFSKGAKLNLDLVGLNLIVTNFYFLHNLIKNSSVS